MRTPLFAGFSLFLLSSACTVVAPEPEGQAAVAEEESEFDVEEATTRAQQNPTPVTKRYLALDGDPGELLKEGSGGGAFALAAVTKSVNGHFYDKTVQSVSFEPLTIVMGLGMDSKKYNWIKGGLAGNQPSFDGEMLQLDSNLKVQGRTTFFDARVSEVTFPTLDAANGVAASLTVKVVPEDVIESPGDNSSVPVANKPAKTWTTNNFNMTMGGSSGLGVTKIDGWTVKAPLPGKPSDVPILKLTASGAAASYWKTWAQSFLVQNNNSDGQERDGYIEMMDPAGKVVFRIDLQGVGLRRFGQVPDSSSYAIELYVEAITFAPVN